MAGNRRDRCNRPRRAYLAGKAGARVLAKDGSRRGARGRQRDGLTAARHFLAAFGTRAIDARTGVGRALAEWRRDLIEDLGAPRPS